MTPSKHGKVTHIKIERRKKEKVNQDDVVYQGGGQHKGLVVNRKGETLYNFFPTLQ